MFKLCVVDSCLEITYRNEIIISISFRHFHSYPSLSGSTQKIPAHKYVLAVGSSVFYAMFYGGLKSEEEVQVPDVEPSAFLTLLRYLPKFHDLS